MKPEFDIKSFSKHLFWDVDRESLDSQKHKKMIVQRVLEYGLLHDWKMLRKCLTIQEIAAISMEMRTLDPRALSFISTISNQAKDRFRCYTTSRSNPRHWNF